MPRYSDKKLNLGEPIASMLADLCAANYNAPALQVIREAVKEHLERRLQEPEMKKRFERARRERLGQPAKVVKLIEQKDD